MAGPDRLEALLGQNSLTGIDFVLVQPDQVTLDVYFLKQPSTLVPPIVAPALQNSVRVHADGLPDIPVTAGWQAAADGRNILRLVAAEPGGFAPYVLSIGDPRIDPFFNNIVFSFKAACPRDVDCEPPSHECPPETPVDFPVDYTARDFWSLRAALLEFAGQRYPAWQDRLEADVGNMLVEVMSSLGDEFAYTQDRIARETKLETATQRRSVRRMARLVDYDVKDGLAATGWLDVTALADGVLPAGTPVQAVSDGLPRAQGMLVAPLPDNQPLPDGAILPVTFEIGRGFAERDLPAGPRSYAISPARNALAPYLWDSSRACLPVGATGMYLAGHRAADLPLDDVPPGVTPGRWVILRTDPADRSLPARRWLVRLVSVVDGHDPLLAADYTQIAWENAQALPFEMDQTVLTLRGNIVPATAGRTVVRRFSIGPSDYAALEPPLGGDPATYAPVPRAVERTGPDASIAYLFSLADSEFEGLTWLARTAAAAAPEIRLYSATLATPASAPKWNGSQWDQHDGWEWRRRLLGVSSSQAEDQHFTLDDGIWRRVVGFRRPLDTLVHQDYAQLDRTDGDGVTVRFGDGVFGAIPSPTASPGTVFEVSYRLGNGTGGNLGADTLIVFDAAALGGLVAAITNPLPTEGGVDPEPLDAVRRNAPDAFRAITYRAVRPEDYAEAAERLDWVQRAGSQFRWTGSWLTAMVTPDPRGTDVLTQDRRSDLQAQLDRFRQAGRETVVPDPIYADIDLQIEICVAPTRYAADVAGEVETALLGTKGPLARRGFFDPDNFTFGAPLFRSRLEATIMLVPGVKAVERMAIRRRGWFDWRPFTELTFTIEPNEIIRLDNDPDHADRGTLRIFHDGGA
ncbi:hypothetical protein [Reyranella sp.]|uniref:hypothetical protein n=1 Tax=Reyranella sp. TaxID=1929291 RepID=UPI003D0EBC9B